MWKRREMASICSSCSRVQRRRWWCVFPRVSSVLYRRASWKTRFGSRATGSSVSPLSMCVVIGESVYFRCRIQQYVTLFAFWESPAVAHVRSLNIHVGTHWGSLFKHLMHGGTIDILKFQRHLKYVMHIIIKRC
jgi:hypothetical protein